MALATLLLAAALHAPLPSQDGATGEPEGVVAATRLSLARAMASAGDDDEAQEHLFVALEALAPSSAADVALRAGQLDELHRLLGERPGAKPAREDALDAAATAYTELARAYQRKKWFDLAGRALAEAERWRPGAVVKMRASLERARAKAPARGAAAAAPGAEDGAGGLRLVDPSSGWKVEGETVVVDHTKDDRTVVMVDALAHEDAHLALEVELPGARRSGAGLVFGASREGDGGFVLMTTVVPTSKTAVVALVDRRAGDVVLYQRRLTLEDAGTVWRLGVRVDGQEITLEVPGVPPVTVRTEEPTRGHYGFLVERGDQTSRTLRTVFSGLVIELDAATIAAEALRNSPALDARVARAAERAEGGTPEEGVAQLLDCRRDLGTLDDVALRDALAAQIAELLESHDALAPRRKTAARTASGALATLADALDVEQRPHAAVAARRLAAQLAGEPPAATSTAPRGLAAEAPAPLSNELLRDWFEDSAGREEIWTGGWTIDPNGALSPQLENVAALCVARRPAPALMTELAVEFQSAEGGTAGLVFGYGGGGTFIAATIHREYPTSYAALVVWDGEQWNELAAAELRFDPAVHETWSTIRLAFDGDRASLTFGTSPPLEADLPATMRVGSPGLIAIGKARPERLRFRNFAMR